jgi:hypothetical protein
MTIDFVVAPQEPWYAARCIFHHRARGTIPACFEERIILLRATGAAEAIRRAEEEAREYAASLEAVEYVDAMDMFHLYEQLVGDGTEVFALLRVSDLDARAYVSQFSHTGSERWRPFDGADENA